MEKINKSKNEKNNKKKRRKNKLKRQISIFTIMLWIFLISTMITITVNSTKKTNALEVEDENWNIQLVMYDRSSDTPNEAITEFTWNAENSSETKQLCMQINYACTTNKGYQPGEIEITIPGISKDSFSEYWRNAIYYADISYYENWLSKNITIASDKLDDVIKKYDWSYSYDSENNIYTFVNNNTIELNEHFEGTIQIVYNLESKFRIKTDLEFKTKINENIENTEEIIAKESNICNFHYITTKKSYTLLEYSEIAPRIDYTKIEDILDDYYWVRYYFVDSSSSEGKFAYGENKIINDDSGVDCIKEKIPEDCVLYDVNLDKIEPKKNDEYYYLKTSEPSFSIYYYYYVGYPKDKYSEGDSVNGCKRI